MIKVQISNKQSDSFASKYCRLVLTEDPATKHRFVENSNGSTEYRMGIGKKKKITPRTFRSLIRSVYQTTKSHQIEFLVVDYAEINFSNLETLGQTWLGSTVAENFLLASYEFRTYKTQKKVPPTLKEITISNASDKNFAAGLKRGLILGEEINKARDLANMPGCDMTPKAFGEAAKKMAAGTKVSVKVLSKAEITKLKMGALLAVGQGSINPVQFIVAEYWGQGKSKKNQPTVLIGKGITYDSGGLNIKPTGAMHDMHLDMSGGASVLSAVVIAAKLGLKKNVIALVPVAENAISDTAMRAGDIVTSMSGQTIEVLHTDAEGRMVLADALTYSKRYDPKVILDVATLTGAALVALGQLASAVMTKDKNLSDKLVTLGEESGDLMWPLPLWDEYKQSLKSHRADVSNISTTFSRFGGAIEGGSFLSFFTPKKVSWAHIDIAPRMESIAADKLAKGATGEPIRLLTAFLEQS